MKGSLDLKAREVGLDLSPGAFIHLLPNVGGFIGGDHVAFLLATGFDEIKDVALALDIGTNTEVCLAADGKLTSLSCPSGPTFEGAHVKHGMRSSDGAIEHLTLDGGRFRYQTIGDTHPIGICGTGLLEAVAQLYQAGIIDQKGRMGDHPRIQMNQGEQHFIITDGTEGLPSIALTQRDVQQLQLAKGAIRAGIRILLEAHNRSEEEITKVMVAGGFGIYLDIRSAVAIGMLPAIPLERYLQMGNAAGVGARLALVSRSQRARASDLARRIDYVEPAAAPRFMQIFAQSMYFG